MSFIVGITSMPRMLDGSSMESQCQSYIASLYGVGASPILLPLANEPSDMRAAYQHIDALCLPGGPDVDPARYGEDWRPECRLDKVATIPALDNCEFQLLEWALQDDLPVLAICRGHQLLNVACGGSLWQDLPAQNATATSHWQTQSADQVSHRIDVVQGSRLSNIIGNTIEVNSMHHQAIRELGEGLVITAQSPDGIIEAVEMPDRRFVMGLQFHPEELVGSQPYALEIFRGFASSIV